MSQYFKSVLNFVNFILFSYFVCLSFCDNQSFQVLIQNDSKYENIDSNSSHQHEHFRNKALLNNTKYKTREDELPSCKDDVDCSSGGKCCIYTIGFRFCVYTGDDCGGYFGQECGPISNSIRNSSIKCEKAFSLVCRPPETPWGPSNICRCNHNMYKGTTKCEDNPKYGSAMQIYKITMIFASCCLALILIIFLVCILRKSYCAPRRQAIPLDNTTIPDIFTLFPHVGNYDGGPLADGTLPPFEKPPTYDETLTLIRNEIGIPPPAYRSGNSPNSSSQSSPEMSSRVLITNPTLFTVSQSNSRTNSGTNSSSEESLAGPSGSRQGIDNPAFC